MEITGTQLLPASREEIWKYLNDPKVLHACIPGCEKFEQINETEFSAMVIANFGPVKAKFNSLIKLENLIAPESYTLSGNGKGGVAGFASGKTDITLKSADQGTELTYQAEIQIGGKLAQVGSRLFKGSINKLTKNFFLNFEEVVNNNGLVEQDQAVTAQII